MIIENQVIENQPTPAARKNPENNLEITDNPYADESSDDDDDIVQGYVDKRIFQFRDNPAHPYPMFLRGCDEVKARNGFVWCRSDTERAKNAEKCSYRRPIPTRGNCVMCGRSGPLGQYCSNRCRYDKMSRSTLRKSAHQREVNYKTDPDLQIKKNGKSQYRIMLTPDNENMIDAVYFANMMYQGVSDDAKNFKFFNKMSKAFQNKAHDQVLSNLERLEDPMVFTFPMAPDCAWWQNLNGLANMDQLDLEDPLPQMKYRCK